MAIQKRSRTPGRPKQSDQEVPTNALILQTATRLFLESGFQKVSIDDVAHAAGLTKASIYYYYRSKGDLFKESMVALMSRIHERIDGILSSEAPLYNRLLAVAKAHLQATTAIDLEGFMRESKRSLSEEQMEAMKMAEEKMFERIEQAFQSGIRSGEVADFDAQFAAHAYINLLKVGNYKDVNGHAPFSEFEKTAEKLLDLIWYGLSKK